MNTIGVIGCGGINSWLLQHLHDLTNTFYVKDDLFIKVFDDDVVEEKNLLRGNQNFSVNDLMLSKAKVLAERYKIDFEETFITKDNLNLLDNFKIVILGVDNNRTRLMVYEYCIQKKIFLIDLRAQGTQIMYVVIDGSKPLEYYKKKYFNNEQLMERVGSCQLQQDIEKDHVECGNKIIAHIGVYGLLLKRLRGEELLNTEWRWVY
jgi:molybdopterin/thiamine biosynthesis adenylyltransferase